MQKDLEKTIHALQKLGKYILEFDEELKSAVHDASIHNKWFTEENIKYALNAIAENYLNEKLLRKWIAQYPEIRKNNAKKVAIIMAGNIPLAGFHDLLCVLLSGHHALIKMSSKDDRLLPFLLQKLTEFDADIKNNFTFAERVAKADAYIATGSNNSARYFEFYFGKYPHIIRKNRNSAAVLTGKETDEELLKLGEDIFRYFGLGCRSVSKIFIPKNYDLNIFLEKLQPFHPMMQHNAYKNNYDYNRTLLIMNNEQHFGSDFLILQEKTAFASPVATLFYEFYDDLKDVERILDQRKEEIQCVVSSAFSGAIPFGDAQNPQLWDYADGADVLKFLTTL